MSRPVVDHLWRHENYQLPLLSDRISDPLSSRKTREREKYVFIKNNKFHSDSIQFHLKCLYRPFKETM